jgi:transcriptional regulator with XRE-family HTH domain
MAKKASAATGYDLFRKLLIEARLKAGLTQTDLAEKLGRLQSYVSKFERGARRLDVIEFLDIARALRADPHAIIRALERR